MNKLLLLYKYVYIFKQLYAYGSHDLNENTIQYNTFFFIKDIILLLSYTHFTINMILCAS